MNIADVVTTFACRMRRDLRGIAIIPTATITLPEGDRDPARIMATELATGRFRVWNGASGRTIFGPASVNYLFRAWHDITGHVASGADFSYHGERETVRAHVASLPGRKNEHLRALVAAEGWGQIVHHSRHGSFPGDQRRFTLACLAHGIDRVAARDWSMT